MKLKEFVLEYGRPYSQELGINLRACDSKEITKWFLASILFAARISETIAKNTYMEFERRNILSPELILQTGWQGLVDILDAGGYVRYDFKTASKLLEVFGNLKKQYSGDLKKLHATARDSRDLEERLKDLGKGIGDVTVSIFLREIRYCWEKAEPKPTPLVQGAMEEFGIADLKEFAKKKGLDLIELETALSRLGKDLRKKKRGVVMRLED